MGEKTDDGTRKDFENLLADWRTRAQRSKIAHYKAAVRFGRRHVLLGVPVVVLIAIVGTAVFATLKERPETWIQITIGLVSILAAALAGMQTFFNYSNRAIIHRTAAAKYGSVQREIEEVLMFFSEDAKILQTPVGRIRRRMDELAESCIDCPQDIWRNADAEVFKLNTEGMIYPNKAVEPTS